MYRFISTRDIKELHTAYKELYSHDLDKKWNKYVGKCPKLAGAMKPGMTAKKLLVADFNQLVKVYFYYLDYIDSLDEAQRTAVKESAEKVFTYKSFSTQIADFLLNPDNKFEIHNCVYCDTEKVSPFNKNGKKVRRFETEHVLDKGTCPLVALSLHNFVPSCGTCNGPDVKGTSTIGTTVDEIKRLSPTNPSYDFWHKVLFVVNPMLQDIANIKRENNPNNYEIDFYYQDKVYKHSVKLFGLKERYNTDYLMDALRLLDAKDRLTPKSVADAAAIFGMTSEEYFENQFHVEVFRNEHKPFRKIREDLLGITQLE